MSSSRWEKALNADEVTAFAARGYVCVNDAFSSEAALEMQDVMWRELLEAFGIDRTDRATWHQPPHDLRRSKTDPGQLAMNTERLLGACDALLDAGSWGTPTHWGRVLVTFPDDSPTEWTVPTGVWHWDSALHENVGGVERLVVFTFFSEVETGGGGTLIVEGSHRLLQSFHEQLPAGERELAHRKLRKRFLEWDPWLQRLSGLEPVPADRNGYFMGASRDVRSIPSRVVELTGRPGDAVICHPLMLHTTAPNHSDVARFMRIKFPPEC